MLNSVAVFKESSPDYSFKGTIGYELVCHICL